MNDCNTPHINKQKQWNLTEKPFEVNKNKQKKKAACQFICLVSNVRYTTLFAVMSHDLLPFSRTAHCRFVPSRRFPERKFRTFHPLMMRPRTISIPDLTSWWGRLCRSEEARHFYARSMWWGRWAKLGFLLVAVVIHHPYAVQGWDTSIGPHCSRDALSKGRIV